MTLRRQGSDFSIRSNPRGNPHLRVLAFSGFLQLAIALSVYGLVLLRRGREPLAFVLLGVAGALESYNASLYIVENWLVDGFGNIADGSVLSQILYWGFNPLWAFAAGLASYFSFRFVLDRLDRAESAAVAAETR